MNEDALLDHFESPYHQGRLLTATHEHYVRNPACGDEVTLQLFLSNGAVTEAWFTGTGCMVSQSAASLLCEYVEERRIDELERLEIPEVLSLVGIPLTPLRQQCGLLAFRALHAALDFKRDPR